jgi:nucleoside-diphosphate-sugar epimerase
VLVTGGTGYIGSHTIAAVLRAGHAVRLLARDPARVGPAVAPLGVDPAGIEVVGGDVTDTACVARAVDGVSAVIHLASVFSMDSRDVRRMNAVNVTGTRNVLTAAHRVGADPIVYGSSYAALLPTREPLHTGLPVGRPGRTVPPYFRLQAEAERFARRLQDDGAPLVIVNLLTTLGPHDPHLGDQLTRLRNAALDRMRLMPQGGFCVSDVRDTAALLAATLTPGLGPRRLIPPGRYVSTRDYLSTLGDVVGRRLHSLFPPARAVLPLCWCVDVVQHVYPWHIPAEYTAAYMCYCDTRLDPSVPAAPLGVEARPLHETMADSVRWLYEQGHLTARQAGLVASTR